MKKKTKLSLILSSLAIMAVAGATMAGGTYALFTSESKVNIAVNSGKVDVTATISDLKTYSGKANSLTGDVIADEDNIVLTETEGIFTNGGTAKIEGSALILDKMTPGDKVTFKISVTNNSTVASKYRTLIKEEGGTGLFDGLKFTIAESNVIGRTKWKELSSNSEPNGINIATFDCVVSLPSDAGNEYQGKSANILFSVEAVQGNVQTYVYPAGVTKDSFASASNVVTTDSSDTSARYAFTKVGDNTVYYAADLKAALNADASAIYVNEDATLNEKDYSHYAVSNDLVIYANDVDFGGKDLALGSNGTSINNTASNLKLEVHDSFGLNVWGESPAENVTQEVLLDNCYYTGAGRTKGNGIFYVTNMNAPAYGTLKLTINDCYTSDCSVGVYMNVNGSITVKNSIFRNCATGIKASHKENGNLIIDVTDTKFSCCGADENKYPNVDKYLYEDSSAIKCKTKGSITLNLTNVSVLNPIGEKAFHIDDDEHDTKYTGTTTVNATNVTVDDTAYNFN